MWLLENYKEIEKIEDVQPFVVYDGHRFDLSEERPYSISIRDIYDYYRETGSTIPKSILMAEIVNMIEAGKLPVQKEIKSSTSEVLLPGESFLRGASWISLMIQPEESRIIGSYNGDVKCLGEMRSYNESSIIVLSSDFRGKGLCGPLATFTYRKLKERFGVEFICLAVAAKKKVYACRCYARAAMNAGFTPYLDQEEVDAIERCEIFDVEPSTKMILLNNNSNITINAAAQLC
jgi:hypothetical protein